MQQKEQQNDLALHATLAIVGAVKINCPICKAQAEVPADFDVRPFCSARCKKIDLLNWLEGNYSLPRELSAEDLDQLPPEQRDELLENALDATKKQSSH